MRGDGSGTSPSSDGSTTPGTAEAEVDAGTIPGTAPPLQTGPTFPDSDDPCAPRGYVTDLDGTPARPTGEGYGDGLWIVPDDIVPEGAWPTAVYVRDDGYGNEVGPPAAPPARPFDFDQDGVDDVVEAVPETGEVVLTTASGAVVVTGVRTDFSDTHHYATIRGNQPLTVGDVTGDGRPDLVIASRGEVAVLTGPGADLTPTTVPFDRIGVDVPGWITPPVAFDYTGPGNRPNQQSAAPFGDTEPMYLRDLTGDGAGEILVYNHAARSQGPWMLLLGQPCHGIAATERAGAT